VAREEELLTATLDERLAAARRMQAWGYPVALHFDPLIYFPGCEREYAALAERVFAEVDPARVVWASVGALRFPPAMKRTIERRFPKTKIVYGELVPGADGKLRYVREVRRRLYGALIGGLTKYLPAERIVFSMESPDIWAEFLGATMQRADDIARRMDDCCDAVIGRVETAGSEKFYHRGTETQRTALSTF
jgi:spore photoproduct lyase